MTVEEACALLESDNWKRMPVNFRPQFMIGGVRYMAVGRPGEETAKDGMDLDAYQFWPVDQKNGWKGVRMGGKRVTQYLSGPRSEFCEIQELQSPELTWYSQYPSNLAGVWSSGPVDIGAPDFGRFVRQWPSNVRSGANIDYKVDSANNELARKAARVPFEEARAQAAKLDLERREREVRRKEQFAEVATLKAQSIEASKMGERSMAFGLLSKAERLQQEIQGRIDAEAKDGPRVSMEGAIELLEYALPPYVEPPVKWESPKNARGSNTYAKGDEFDTSPKERYGIRDQWDRENEIYSERPAQRQIAAAPKIPVEHAGKRRIVFEDE